MAIETKDRTGRVLYCHPSADFYGSDRMALETVKVLAADGFDVILVTPDSGLLTERAGQDGVRRRSVRVAVVRKKFLRPLRFPVLLVSLLVGTAKAVALMTRLRPDVVYVNTIIQPSWMVAAALLRLPLVVHVRELESTAPRLVQRALLAPVALATKIVCNSRSTEAWVRRNVGRRSLDRTSTVYNGKHWKTADRDHAVLSRSSVDIALVGRLSPRKGQDLAIEALAVLRGRGVDAHLHIVGSAFAGYEPFVRELKDRCAVLGLVEHCSFLGYVEDTAGIYGAADITWIPSRQEPFGSIVLEAMACGSAVVASEVEGLAEIVDSGVNGLLFRTGDIDSLVTETMNLVDRPEFARRLVVEALATVHERFSSAAYAQAIVADVRELTPVGQRLAR